MLLCRRLSSITGRAHRIHHRAFFTQTVLRQTETTTPEDCSVPPCQGFNDAKQDTPVTHPTGTPEQQTVFESASSTIAAYVYDRKRRKDPEVILGLTSDPYVQELREAKQKKDYHLIRTLIGQIILVDGGSETTRANKLHFALLSVSLIKLPPKMVISMLRTVTTFLGQEYHSTEVVYRIIQLIVESTSNSARELLDLIFPSLLFHLQNTKLQETMGTPSPFVLASFALLRWLLPCSQERSVELYKILVDTGHVPSTTLQDEHATSGTLHTLLYASTIRTCCQKGWTELAADFLDDYLKKNRKDSQTLGTNLILELVGYLLDSPSEEDLQRCCNFIIRLHTIHPVPDEVIHDFYAIAAQFKLSRPAEHLYSFTREKRIDKSKPHQYPLPQGRSLVWLAENLVKDDLTRPSFESLVNEAHEQHQDVLIPVSHQPLYLTIVVKEGFGLIAQSLWEKWTPGINGEVIRGSPKILVRIIRLTMSLTRKQEERLALLKGCRPRDTAEIDASKRSLNEISSFAQKVLRAFITQHEPLRSADHLALTSLARAHFVLGNVNDGFHCFQILLRRRSEKPDIVDINVGLSALAEYKPRSAAAFLATMLHHKIQPDEFTFSTIMHHAMIKDDLDLCTELGLQMKETLLPGSNFLAFYSMALASVVERVDDTPQRRVVRLRTVLKVLQSMNYPKDVFITRPEVGESLIRGSLPHYPQIAFEFWKVVTKDVLSHDDPIYRGQVQVIRNAFRKAWNLGNIKEVKMKEMLSELLQK
ncbi:hypothetical protein BYT27DRAFT_7150153 [Phlegmacium glaucopus]|nr:hypothetical protein BYT27DRAFT_7150153 [Phlegmacium glaucopus]